MRVPSSLWAPLFLLLPAFGCSTQPIEPDQPAPPFGDLVGLDRIEFDSGIYYLDTTDNTVAQLHVSGYQEGDSAGQDLTTQAQFSVADMQVATVSPSGLVTAVADGSTTVWATVNGLTSVGARVQVGGGPYELTIEAGSSVQAGKLVDLELRVAGVELGAASSIELEVPGTVPFGQDREDAAWWGIDTLDPDLYHARLMVLPTTPPGDLDVTLLVDDELPETLPSLSVQANSSLSTTQNCAFFQAAPASDFDTTGGGANLARTWRVGQLASSAIYRLTVASPDLDVAPQAMSWSLDGELINSNDGDPSIANPTTAALQFTVIEAEANGEGYFTATVAEAAAEAMVAGSLETDCLFQVLPEPVIEASDSGAFPAGGRELAAGENSVTFDLSTAALEGNTVSRVYAYLDLQVDDLSTSTVSLRSPSGSEVLLMDGSWAEDYMSPAGRFRGTLGAPAPHIPTASELNGGGGTETFSGSAATGNWQLVVNHQGGSTGTWYDAALWVDTVDL